MLDRDRILAKLDEFDGYLDEIDQVAPASFDEYQQIPVKRSCERLLQMSVECVIDVCALFVAGLDLGLPADESDIFDELEDADVLDGDLLDRLREMKGFRNVLVHKYGTVDDRIVYEVVTQDLDDFRRFRTAALDALDRLEG